MHRLLLFLLLPALLTGCATISMTPVVKEKWTNPYRKVMTLVVEDENMDFYQLDPQTYERHIRGNFNSLANIEYQRQLERTLQRNLGAQNSRVLASFELFEVNEDVPYETFTAMLEEQGVQAVLLINLRDFWFSKTKNYDTNSGIVREDQEPNAAFLCYLIDYQSRQPVWMAQSTVRGIWAGYDTLNNHLARRIATELRKDLYVFLPVSAR